MKLTDLRVNNIKTPLGFAVTPLSFSWKVTEAGAAKNQKYVRIKVWQGEQLLYDSGEDTAGNSVDYRVNLKLEPRKRYEWSVEVAADNGESAHEKSWFETGKMEETWSGKWITSTLDPDTPPVLRKSFDVKETKKQARLYVCGLGVYEVYLNGKKVGQEYLAPGYHSYDFHLQAQTYDVTEYLKTGKNEIQIWLGDGWFRGRLGFDGGYTNCYGNRTYAIAELYAGDEKNSSLILKTDEEWSCKPSPVIFSNIYDGEIYDARLEAALSEEEVRKPVKTALSENLAWKPVKAAEPENCGKLVDRYSLPVVKKEQFAVCEVIQTPKGEMVLDFGQNLTGWVEFDCELLKGMQVRMTASEIMQDGCFYHENLRTAKTEFVYISDGKRKHVHPHFTFYGFRYMKLEYLDAEGKILEDCAGRIEKIIAYHLRSDFDQIGSIQTGNPKVNKLFLNALWGQKDNFLDVPTDCPQRDERLGWTGDAQIFSETACYNMYMPAFYRKYLWDMRAEQSALDGSVPNVVPRLKKGMVAEYGACPWADAGVVIPWNVYLHYGNKTLLEECYPGMKAWVNYQRRKEEAIGGLHLVKDGFHFADWLALDNEQPGPFGATDPLYIASAYYYLGAKYVSEAAKVLGNEKESEEYRELAEEIRNAIQKTYFDENGLCVCKTQTGSAIAIAFNLIPERAELSAEGNALRQRVEENGGHLNTGFVGTTFLCRALTQSGHHETAMNLFLKETFPGWLYAVNLGATTIWERWDSVLPDGHLNQDGMNSLNHYSYGSIEAWMYGFVCGIQPLEAGFRKALINPHPDQRLGYADCQLDTAAGIYRSSWKYNDDGSVTYKIEVPFHAEAELQIGEEHKKLTAGKYEFTENAFEF